ncbi:hypothetical protein DASC09_017350 [Saccharomycopsis crataegensis]|uniref:MMS19 nucleotide excision repair protein n=1 Tax=Saccharomycopsis crataegensis TaxID=43959 RepID=A0AAV5QIV0_9ASCO|nr:hypothetical protein DASC09_017350 [Saccharomycopsis crataegensis]
MTTQSFRSAVKEFVLLSKDNHPEGIGRLSSILANSANDTQIYSSTLPILVDLYSFNPSPSPDDIIKSNLLHEVMVYLEGLYTHDKQDNLDIKEATLLFEKLHPKLSLEGKMRLLKDYRLAEYLWGIMTNEDPDLIGPYKKLFNLYFGNAVYRTNALDQWIIETFMIPVLKNPSNLQSMYLCFELLSKLHSNVIPDTKLAVIICDLLKPISLKYPSSTSKALGLFKKPKAPKPTFHSTPVIIGVLQYLSCLFDAHKESIGALVEIEVSTKLRDWVCYLSQELNSSFEIQYHLQYFLHFFLITNPNLNMEMVRQLLASNIFIIRELFDMYKNQTDPMVRQSDYPKDILVVRNFEFLYLRERQRVWKSGEDENSTDQRIDIAEFINYLLDNWKSANITNKEQVQAMTDLLDFCLPKIPQNKKRSLVNKLFIILNNDNQELKLPVANFYRAHCADNEFSKMIDDTVFFFYVAKKMEKLKDVLQKSNGKEQILCEEDRVEFFFISQYILRQSTAQHKRLHDTLCHGDYLNFFVPKIIELQNEDAMRLMNACVGLSLASFELNEEYYSTFSTLLAGAEDEFKRLILMFLANVIIQSKRSDHLISHPTFLMEIYSLALSSENDDVKFNAYKVLNVLIMFIGAEKREILNEIVKEWDFFNVLLVPVLEDSQSFLHEKVFFILENLGKNGGFEQEFEATNAIPLMVDYFCTRPGYRKYFILFIRGYFDKTGANVSAKSICLYKANIFKTLPVVIELLKPVIAQKNFAENISMLEYLCQFFGTILDNHPICVKDIPTEQNIDIFSITFQTINSAPTSIVDKINIKYFVLLWRGLDLAKIPAADMDDFWKTLLRLFNDCLPKACCDDDTFDQVSKSCAEQVIQGIITIVTKYIGDTPNKSKDSRAAYYFLKPMLTLLSKDVPLSLTVSIWQFFYKVIRDRENDTIVKLFFENMTEAVVPSYRSVIMIRHLWGEDSVATATISLCWKVVTYYPNTVYETYIFEDFGVNESMDRLKERFKGDVKTMKRLKDIEDMAYKDY